MPLNEEPGVMRRIREPVIKELMPLVFLLLLLLLESVTVRRTDALFRVPSELMVRMGARRRGEVPSELMLRGGTFLPVGAR